MLGIPLQIGIISAFYGAAFSKRWDLLAAIVVVVGIGGVGLRVLMENGMLERFLKWAQESKSSSEQKKGDSNRTPFDFWVEELYLAGRRSGSLEDLIQEYIRVHGIRIQKFIDESPKITDARTKVAVLNECDHLYLEDQEIGFYYRVLSAAVSGHDRAQTQKMEAETNKSV